MSTFTQSKKTHKNRSISQERNNGYHSKDEATMFMLETRANLTGDFIKAYLFANKSK